MDKKKKDGMTFIPLGFNLEDLQRIAVNSQEMERIEKDFWEYAYDLPYDFDIDVPNSFYEADFFSVTQEEREVSVPESGNKDPNVIGFIVGRQSIKVSNFFVNFNLEKALGAGIKAVESVKTADSLDNLSLLDAIKYVLSLFLWVYKETSLLIGETELKVVYWLHKNGHYKTPCKEEEVIKAISAQCTEDGNAISADDIRSAISFL